MAATEQIKQETESENITFHQLDLTEPDTINACVEFVKEKFGQINVLINNAAISFKLADAVPFEEQVCHTLIAFFLQSFFFFF
jgi:NAD(P)-dependent dehydrogenase (short-subunit alcohol dehydrogenase family)